MFENSIIHKPSLGHAKSHTKFGPQSVQPFRGLLDTNRQTDKQSMYIDGYKYNTDSGVVWKANNDK